MRVLVTTQPAYGHLHPLVPLCQALAAAGHEVAIVDSGHGRIGHMRLGDLLAEPLVREECRLRSPVGFLALHGGSQDRGSDHIARRAAELSGASIYAIVQPPSLRVHIPSHRHDPADSDALTRFLSHIDVAISVHGFGRDSLRLLPDPAVGLRVEPYGPPLKDSQKGPHRGVILGGRNRELAARAHHHLERRLPSFRFVAEVHRLGPLAGQHPANPVNLPRRAGVQVELPPALRGIGPLGEVLVPRTDDPAVQLVVEALAEVAIEADAIPAPLGAALSRPAGPYRQTGDRGGVGRG